MKKVPEKAAKSMGRIRKKDDWFAAGAQTNPDYIAPVKNCPQCHKPVKFSNVNRSFYCQHCGFEFN